jgi:hypothetical protein
MKSAPGTRRVAPKSAPCTQGIRYDPQSLRARFGVPAWEYSQYEAVFERAFLLNNSSRSRRCRSSNGKQETGRMFGDIGSRCSLSHRRPLKFGLRLSASAMVAPAWRMAIETETGVAFPPLASSGVPIPWRRASPGRIRPFPRDDRGVARCDVSLGHTPDNLARHPKAASGAVSVRIAAIAGCLRPSG